MIFNERHRGPLDLEVRIDELHEKLINHEKVLQTTLEENGNLKTLISRLQDEKLEMQKQLADLHYQHNIEMFNRK
jgi:predicted RNase H-like nuclease (RuvC/YqgF family)